MSGLIAVITTFIVFPLTAAALDYTLLEPIPGILPNQVIAGDINLYLLGIFRLVIGLAGVLSVIMITWCGFNLMLSGSPSAREDAKRCIRATLLGLLLALSSYFVINSIEVGFNGGAGAGGPFAIPLLVNAPLVGPGGGQPVGLPGSPICNAVSANINLVEGQITDITAQCNPAATGYAWTTSPGAPVVAGVGGNIGFFVAGVYTYVVSGQNAVGMGPMSNILTITVVRQNPGSCPQDMPEPVVGPIGCAQVNDAHDWSALGTGTREDTFVNNAGESVSILFSTVGLGAYGSFDTRGIVDPDTNVPINLNVSKFVNISPAMCDFRYGNLDTNGCAASGIDVRITFQVGMGNPPDGSGGCVLDPNTAYNINIRNEEAGGVNASRTLDTCPSRRICEFIGRFTQSQAAQFVQPQFVQCAPPPLPVPQAPAFDIFSPQNNAVFRNGNIPIQYRASDPQDLTSVQFTIFDAQTGDIISSTSTCSSGGVGTTIDPVTGNVTIVNIPPCGQQRAQNFIFSLNRVAGDYRLEGRACGLSGQCARRDVLFSIVPLCVNSNRLGCFALPIQANAAGQICTPQYGNQSSLVPNMTHAHQFQLPPNTRAEIIVANQPVFASCCDFFPDPNFGFPVWQCMSYQPQPAAMWCTEDGLLGDAWSTITGGNCAYGRNDMRRGDLSLRVGISSAPGDLSASDQTTVAIGGNAEGVCGTSEQLAIGRTRLVVSTIAPLVPGECLINANRDYYLNVASIFDFMPVRGGWANDPYGVVINILP